MELILETITDLNIIVFFDVSFLKEVDLLDNVNQLIIVFLSPGISFLVEDGQNILKGTFECSSLH